MRRLSLVILVFSVLSVAIDGAAQTQSTPRGITSEFQDAWTSAQEHMDAKDDAGAEQIILPALDRARQHGNKDAEAEFLRELGASYQHRSNFREAMNYYGQSLAIRQELGEEVESARLFRGIGETHALLREDDEAISFLKRADAAYAKLNQTSLEAQTLSTLGQVYNRQGRMEESATALTKACRIFQEARDGTAHGRVRLSARRFERAAFGISRCAGAGLQCHERLHSSKTSRWYSAGA